MYVVVGYPILKRVVNGKMRIAELAILGDAPTCA